MSEHLCAADLMNWADWASFALLMVLGTWKMIELVKKCAQWFERKLDKWDRR